MSDMLDEAAIVTEMMLQKAIQKRSKVPELTGFCLSCEEPTTGAFCSSECREDYEKIERLKAIRGAV